MIKPKRGSRNSNSPKKGIKALSPWRVKVYLSGYGITEEEIEVEKTALLKKFNLSRSYPTLLNDVVWNLLNKLTFNYAHDFQKLSSIHFTLGAFLEYEGQRRKMIIPQSLLASKYQLLDLKARGRDKVKCISATKDKGACTSCAKMNNQVFPIYQIIKELPLPNKCSNKRCRCTYAEAFSQ